MPTVQFYTFDEFMARLANDPVDETKGLVLGMHLVRRRVTAEVDPETSEVTELFSERQSPEPVGWAELVYSMNDENLAALDAAVQAEIASRE